MDAAIRGVNRETDRRAKYEATPKAQQRNARRNVSKAVRSEQAYLEREFVAWDGEGGNDLSGEHHYFLLANSDGMCIANRQGLDTRSVFSAFLSARQGVTHIGYGLGYDINMILRDLDRPTLERLYTHGRVRWEGYRLEWRAGKSFNVRYGDRSFLLYDVLPFFQCPFVQACDEYLGNDWYERERIIADKARRGQFDWGELNEIKYYNAAEVQNLVSLAKELRSRLYRVGIRVTRWDGPGAIATALYRRYSTKDFMGGIPEGVATASRYAYAGGRFEIIRKGHSDSPSYQYDIRSAYPSAIRRLPCLSHGEWRHVSQPTRIVPFGVYRIEVDEPYTTSPTQPHPLWMRNKDGTVFFNEYTHGWYWTPEAELAVSLGGVTVHEGWEWIRHCDHTPFDFVEPLYLKRAALKKAGDGAHVGLKLGLNSLYGKLAQQIGWDPGPPLRIPPYHSLEWAGYITSHCRTQVYQAAMLALDDVIAFETDAIFSRVPLDLDIGTGLGQWELTEYKSLTYLKSGMYFGTLATGKEVEKCRGINKGSITRYQLIEALNNQLAGRETMLNATQTRFIGLGQALHQDFAKWRRWFTAPKTLSVSLSGKRIDLLYDEGNGKHLDDGWYETQEGFSDTDFSYPYEIEWLETTDIESPDGMTLSEVRVYNGHEVIE